ncbi:hypothetical protein ABW20_dc0106370 [Dactylellina cionopaga]|nr:hypothetical protein ABW20_dc0106370 [Dactylellina cionopaga]
MSINGRKMGLVARSFASKLSFPVPRGTYRTPQCPFRQDMSNLPRSQWKTISPSIHRTIFCRWIHTSTPLGTLPKQKYDHINLDRFHTGGKRKYNLFKLETWREAYHETPKMFMFAVFSTVVCVVSTGFALRFAYQELFLKLHNYPEDVAKHMRRALYYEAKWEIEGCVRNYQRAITATEALQMDPLSDEVTGLKIKYAEIGEKVGAYSKAIEYLEKLRFEMLALMDDRKEELGVVGRLKLMKKVIGIATKIGDLQLVMKDEHMAEKTFEWTVAEMLRIMDSQSRLKEEGPWTAEEFAAVFENAASTYARSNKFDYASTLYLQAANLFHPPTCHSVVLLNNVGASNMQRQIPSGEPMDRTNQLESAKKWMLKALDVAANIKPPVRNEECDQGCVVALHNVGEVEEQLGRLDEAKAKFIEAESLSWAIGYEEGYKNAAFGLERIKHKETGTYEDSKQKEEEKIEEEDKTAAPGGLPPLTFSGVGKK